MARSSRPSPLALAAHLLIVLLISSSWAGVLSFFLLSWGVVTLAGRVPGRAGTAARGAGLVLLTAALLWLRGELSLGPRPLGLRFLGQSYCYLRAVYALLEPQPWGFRSYARYYFFFPTFVSGPVTRPEHVAAARRPNREDVREGLGRIVYGLTFVLAAQVLGRAALLSSNLTLYWGLDHARGHPLTLWAGLALSGLWLYLDFSGFSDVFIGLAQLTGVRAPENFKRPFAATDVTSFWQRWHVSLADWLRGVVYTPASRLGLRALPPGVVAGLAPLMTMLVCGLWHQAALAYLLWGAWHGLALGLHALWQRVLPALSWRRLPAYRAASWVLTQLLVCMSWALFLPVDPTVTLASRVDLLRHLLGVA